MKCTHIALQVRDMASSVRFYERFCGMKPVHQRAAVGDSKHVVWVGWGEDPPKFVIVLIEADYDHNEQPPWQHIGMAVDSRDEVDEIHQRAVDDGIEELWEPVEGGPIVGYYCAVPDPDGNIVEFSYGQRIG